MRLPLHRPARFDRELFVVSDCNREAATAVDAWPAWPAGCLTLVGPEGSGKTHLARSWAARARAQVIDGTVVDVAGLPAGPVLLEDADRREDDALLFHLINRAQAGASLLLTSRQAPRQWRSNLPDLRSRLNAMLAVELGPPDDVLLESLLVKFFRDRNIRPDREVLAYLLRRIERSAPAARDVVRRLDEAADTLGRGVTRALAREVLDAVEPSSDGAE